MKTHATSNMPFGWEDGDPLVVCINYQHMEYVQKAFQLRAYYCLRGDSLGGRRFGKIILFHRPGLSDQEEESLRRWKDELLMTKLWPADRNKFYLV